jgi:hypothetical protein
MHFRMGNPSCIAKRYLEQIIALTGAQRQLPVENEVGAARDTSQMVNVQSPARTLRAPSHCRGQSSGFPDTKRLGSN